MSPVIKHGAVIISLLTALAIIASALLFKDTAYENAWLYILAAGSVLAGFAEVYAKKKERDTLK